MLVCGAGGFIGGHLVRRLKDEGPWVRGVELKRHEFRAPDCPLREGIGKMWNRIARQAG